MARAVQHSTNSTPEEGPVDSAAATAAQVSLPSSPHLLLRVREAQGEALCASEALAADGSELLREGREMESLEKAYSVA